MGDLVVQQFVSADGFAANDENEFDLFDGVEGDSTEFDQSNLEWLESVGADHPRRVDVQDVRELLADAPVRWRAGGAEDQLRLTGSETVGGLVAVDYAVVPADR